ncbi:hypothetical protein STEG23_037890 [Scotinomys teguina]
MKAVTRIAAQRQGDNQQKDHSPEKKDCFCVSMIKAVRPWTTLAVEAYPSSRLQFVCDRPCCRCSRYAIRPAGATEGLRRGVFLLPDLTLKPDSERPRGLDVFSNVPFPHHGSKLRGEWESGTLWESDASTRCMDENNYDRERCSNYFLKYKNCRRFWIITVVTM